MHPPGWLIVGGFAVGGIVVLAGTAVPVSAMRLSLSPVGSSDVGVVAGGSVLEGSVVLDDTLLRVCLDSLRGGLVIWVVFPSAKPCCCIKSSRAALMVAI